MYVNGYLISGGDVGRREGFVCAKDSTTEGTAGGRGGSIVCDGVKHLLEANEDGRVEGGSSCPGTMRT